MLPVDPTVFRNLVPAADDDACSVLKKANLFAIYWWSDFSYWFDGNGNFSAEFVSEICTAFNRQAPSLSSA